ncbi:MAG TPA: alpha-ketoacid dehydrogenase subunit beta [Gammaproteobacteria bacterium]|nr:alpha-ketoacid dehydrogenase subunit beta [Gammaproteobacteria bacterium]
MSNNSLRFGQALNRALGDAMRTDESVILFGEDVALAGGPFGVTRNLLAEFGERRVRDYPIAEASMVNLAIGAALGGYRPVVEIMFMDFCTLAMDALVNQAAKAHFMFGGQSPVPLVVRTPHGGGLNAGPQHSQCLEAWFTHIPGLIVLCPSNAADAYGLLRAAIDNPNPVLFIENKRLYAAKGDVPEPPQPVEIGKARLVRPGSDLTLVTYGATVGMAEKAALTQAQQGIEIEIIDLRSLQPWDEQTVLESLSRTHRLLILHEATEAFGVGAEIAARMADIGFDELDAPIIRLGAPFVPIPYSVALEADFGPTEQQLDDAIARLLQ